MPSAPSGAWAINCSKSERLKSRLPPRQLHVRDFAFSCPPPDCRRATNTGKKFAYLTSAKKLLTSGYIVFTHVNIINKNSQKVHVVHNGRLAVFSPNFYVSRCKLDPSRTLIFCGHVAPKELPLTGLHLYLGRRSLTFTHYLL